MMKQYFSKIFQGIFYGLAFCLSIFSGFLIFQTWSQQTPSSLYLHAKVSFSDRADNRFERSSKVQLQISIPKMTVSSTEEAVRIVSGNQALLFYTFHNTGNEKLSYHFDTDWFTSLPKGVLGFAVFVDKNGNGFPDSEEEIYNSEQSKEDWNRVFDLDIHKTSQVIFRVRTGGILSEPVVHEFSLKASYRLYQDGLTTEDFKPNMLLAPVMKALHITPSTKENTQKGDLIYRGRDGEAHQNALNKVQENAHSPMGIKSVDLMMFPDDEEQIFYMRLENDAEEDKNFFLRHSGVSEHWSVEIKERGTQKKLWVKTPAEQKKDHITIKKGEFVELKVKLSPPSSENMSFSWADKSMDALDRNQDGVLEEILTIHAVTEESEEMMEHDRLLVSVQQKAVYGFHIADLQEGEDMSSLQPVDGERITVLKGMERIVAFRVENAGNTVLTLRRYMHEGMFELKKIKVMHKQEKSFVNDFTIQDLAPGQSAKVFITLAQKDDIVHFGQGVHNFILHIANLSHMQKKLSVSYHLVEPELSLEQQAFTCSGICVLDGDHFTPLAQNEKIRAGDFIKLVLTLKNITSHIYDPENPKLTVSLPSPLRYMGAYKFYGLSTEHSPIIRNIEQNGQSVIEVDFAEFPLKKQNPVSLHLLLQADSGQEE